MLTLVTYDLNNESQRPPIVKAISEIGACVRLSESSYAINTDLSPQQIYDSLNSMIDQDDQLYVIRLGNLYAGFGPEKVNQFLSSHL